MSNTSLWISLRNPIFRGLWISSIVSGVCVSAHDTAATWVMNTLTPSMFLISVMSTVAALPFFLFTLPAGALADMVDRKKLLLVGRMIVSNPFLGQSCGDPLNSWTSW